MNEIRKIKDDFSDLSSKGQIASKTFVKHGNVMKHSPEIEPVLETLAKKDEPEIVVQREDEVITRIEFMCPCGQRSEVHFEYDGE